MKTIKYKFLLKLVNAVMLLNSNLSMNIFPICCKSPQYRNKTFFFFFLPF